MGHFVSMHVANWSNYVIPVASVDGLFSLGVAMLFRRCWKGRSGTKERFQSNRVVQVESSRAAGTNLLVFADFY